MRRSCSLQYHLRSTSGSSTRLPYVFSAWRGSDKDGSRRTSTSRRWYCVGMASPQIDTPHSHGEVLKDGRVAVSSNWETERITWRKGQKFERPPGRNNPRLKSLLGTMIHLKSLEENPTWTVLPRNARIMLKVTLHAKQQELYFKILGLLPDRLAQDEQDIEEYFQLLYGLIELGQAETSKAALEHLCECGTIKSKQWAYGRLIKKICAPELPYANPAQAASAVSLVKYALSNGHRLDWFTWKRLLRRCTLADDAGLATEVWDLYKVYHPETRGIDIAFCNQLIKFYASKGNLSGALGVLDFAEENNIAPTEKTFTSIIALYAKMKMDVTPLFERMKRLGVTPNEIHKEAAMAGQFTQTQYISSSESNKQDEPTSGNEKTKHTQRDTEGDATQPESTQSVDSPAETSEQKKRSLAGLSLSVITQLIQSKRNEGHEDEAFEIFDRMQRETTLEPDVVLYTAMIGACIDRKDCRTALELLETMKMKGLEMTPVTYLQFFTCCAKCKEMDIATQVWEELEERAPDMLITKVYNSYLNVCVAVGDVGKATSLYERMKFGPRHSRPSEATYTILLSMWAARGDLEQCKKLLARVMPSEMMLAQRHFPPLFAACEKSRNLVQALNLLDVVKRHGIPYNLFMWRSLAAILYQLSLPPPPSTTTATTTDSRHTNGTTTEATTATTPNNNTTTTDTSTTSTVPGNVPVPALFVVVEELAEEEAIKKEIQFMLNVWIERYYQHNNKQFIKPLREGVARLREKRGVTIWPNLQRWLDETAADSLAPKNRTREPHRQQQQQQQQHQQVPSTEKGKD